MNHRILFVDDEPNILHGLRRMLRSKRKTWSMSFAHSGKEALELLESQRCDLVVSDMKMPEMDGAELLTRTRNIYPDTTRITLSGHSEVEAILRSIGPTHLYLAKPCEHEYLIATIDRILKLNEILPNSSLRALAKGIDTLRIPKDVFNNLSQVLSEHTSKPETVISIIQGDLALTANLLKITNSAYFRSNKTNLTPSDSIRHIGTDIINCLVNQSAVFSPFDSTSDLANQANHISSESVAIGQRAKAIAHFFGFEKLDVDLTYLAGTLAKTGSLLLLTQKEDISAYLKDQPSNEGSTTEEVAPDTLPDRLGAYLLGLWGSAPSIVEAIAFQNTPSKSESRVTNPLACVHLAINLWLDAESRHSLDYNYIEEIGLASDLPKIKTGANRILEEVAHSSPLPKQNPTR